MIVATGEQVLVEADYRMSTLADPNVRTDLEAPGLQGFDDFELGLRAARQAFFDRVGAEVEGA